ncbi:MAG TPA: phosphogluconate dehydrogenase (NADP(+)-dependent, decarboxylating) [Blastocatellia bacterium]|nr:phosphogluconate dehydrogenase (NADP(+)-dependent, decarboxylating) [Blastocatellia bacterium]
MSQTLKIGLIGLGVMGQNLALNIERNGYPIAVYDREPPVLDAFLARETGKQIAGARSPEEFVQLLERPRKIILLVKAGGPVDWTIDLIKPFLNEGDIIIDGGNSHFKETERRQQELSTAGLFLIGSGTSGGEKGALLGPSLMPGGDKNAYEQIRPIWEAIAAKVPDGPCVTYIGPGGSGHFVKMVHNGIEYGDMQLIAEAYGLIRNGFGLSAEETAAIFDEWNRGDLESYLIEITAKILRVKDEETGKPLVDLVLDKAGQKGTGKWTSQIALDLGTAIPTIDAAITARILSSQKEARVAASTQISARTTGKYDGLSGKLKDYIHDALYASKICSYAQGMNLIKAGSEEFGWKINLSEVARIWQGGCIIRAKFLGKIKEAYLRNVNLANLLLDNEFKSKMDQAQSGWRIIVSTAMQQGLPVLAMSSSLGYFDMYRTANLPLNLTQAQRDFFGSHTYERIDKPELGFIHTEWEELLEKQKSGQ